MKEWTITWPNGASLHWSGCNPGFPAWFVESIKAMDALFGQSTMLVLDGAVSYTYKPLYPLPPAPQAQGFIEAVMDVENA